MAASLPAVLLGADPGVAAVVGTPEEGDQVPVAETPAILMGSRTDEVRVEAGAAALGLEDGAGLVEVSREIPIDSRVGGSAATLQGLHTEELGGVGVAAVVPSAAQAPINPGRNCVTSSYTGRSRISVHCSDRGPSSICLPRGNPPQIPL